MQHIKKSDIVIVDATNPAFVTGMDAGMAITSKVPTIIIEASPMEKDLYKDVIAYMNKKSKNITSLLYSCTDDLEEFENVLHNIEKLLHKERVHVLLEKYLNDYLTWKVENSEFSNKTEILKHLISKQYYKDFEE